MSNCILSFENYVQATVTTINAHGSEVSGLGADRLKEPQVRKRWRTPIGTVGPIVDFDFGSPKDIDVVAFQQPVDAGGLNADRVVQGYAAATDPVRHLFSLVAEGGAEVYDTNYFACGVKYGFGGHQFVLPSRISARWWRWTLYAGSLAGGVNYLDMGLMWAGTKYQPQRNMQYGYNWAFVDLSTVTSVQSSGLDYVRYGFKRRTINFSFDTMSAADADIISTMMNYSGTSRQVLFIPDPADTASDFAQPIIGRLVDGNPISLPSYGVNTKSFTLIQSL